MQVKKQQLETDMEQLTGSKLGKAYNKTVTLLSIFTFHFYALEMEMATHSSVLAWRIPGTGEAGGLRLWGHTESDTTEVT